MPPPASLQRRHGRNGLRFFLASRPGLTHIVSIEAAENTGSMPVTTVQITLPDDLAQDLAEAGLLDPSVVEAILRDRLRATRIADFAKLRAVLRTNPIEPMTNEEINAEIEAYRAEQRRATGP